MITLIFTGDMDGDGILDLILDTAENIIQQYQQFTYQSPLKLEKW